jgi:hypothetical protein
VIRPQPVPSIEDPSPPVGTVVCVQPRHQSLVSRVLLAVVLAAIAALIPGEAATILEGPLTWSDLFGGLSTIERATGLPASRRLAGLPAVRSDA